MAASTDSDTLSSTAYTEIAADAVSGVVQVRSHGLVRIHVGTSLPSASTDDYVLIGPEGNLSPNFAWSGFTTGDNVYARAHNAGETPTTVTIAA